MSLLDWKIKIGTYDRSKKYLYHTCNGEWRRSRLESTCRKDDNGWYCGRCMEHVPKELENVILLFGLDS